MAIEFANYNTCFGVSVLKTQIGFLAFLEHMEKFSSVPVVFLSLPRRCPQQRIQPIGRMWYEVTMVRMKSRSHRDSVWTPRMHAPHNFARTLALSDADDGMFMLCLICLDAQSICSLHTTAAEVAQLILLCNTFLLHARRWPRPRSWQRTALT